MGLDIALGVLVLIWAIRGWLKGFILQAIGLTGLVGAIFAAAPAREYARPYVQPYLPSIQPALLDRLLWWSAAVLVMALIGGLGGWLYRLSQRRTYGLPDPNRADQGAGFVLGAAKGVILVVFLLAGAQRYLPGNLQQTQLYQDQTKESRAMLWAEVNHPAETLWNLPPVQALVGVVRKNGLGAAGDTPDGAASEPGAADPSATVKAVEKKLNEASNAADSAIQTASRSLGLNIPVSPSAAVEAGKTVQEIDQGLRDLGLPGLNSR